MSILTVYREPFGITPQVRYLPEGLTLAEMAAQVRHLPADFGARGVICINGRRVQRNAWALIKPKPAHNGVPVEVTFHAAPLGGGDNGGKQVFALIASFALTALTGGIAAGGAAKLLGANFAKGTFGAYALAAGVSLVGSLALSALSAPPVAKAAAKAKPNEGASSAVGNVIEPNGSIPRVLGERKIFPPLACEPLTYFDGPDEIVEAVYALSGPHRLNDIRVGSALITDIGVEFETREGWAGDDPITLTTRQSRTQSLQTELRGHIVSDSDGRTLDDSTGGVLEALPQPFTTATRDSPDEQWLHIAFPQGLNVKGSETVFMRVPVRIRLRIRGGSWVNLPELHYQAANIRQLRASINLIWTDTPASSPGAANNEGWVEARKFSPGQVISPAQSDWSADAAFSTTGDDYMAASNLGSTGVVGVELNRYTARIILDTAVFPRGKYDVEIMRGAAFTASNYSASAYTYSGDIWDFFGVQGTAPGQIVRTRDGVLDSLYLLRSVSIRNQHPVQTTDCALIAIRARNRALEEVSTIAGGYVPDWDGTGWRDWTVTDNPAPHLRDVYSGLMNASPVPLDILDDDGLLVWRTDGHHCNAVIEDQSVGEVAGILASCGFARPYMSEIYGVARDYDRSAEAPVQMFTPRNSSGFKWSKGFPRVPDAFRVSFRDADQDYDLRQITVARPGFAGTPRLFEQVTYEGPVTEAEAITRAIYDHNQAQYRNTFYTLDAAAEAIVARRGDLVVVQHDMLTSRSGSGRIIDWEFDGSGNVTQITLDSEVDLVNEPDMLSVTDLLAVPDMLALGLTSAAIIRGPSGPSDPLPLTNATGASDVLVLAAPIAAADVYDGALVSVGPSTKELLRLIVFGVEPRADYQATLTLVDEAPAIWAA